MPGSPIAAALLVAVFGSGLLGGGLAIYTWQRRGVPGARSFSFLVGVMAGWSLARGVLWLSPGGAVTLLINRIDTALSLIGTFGLLVFVLDYTGHDEWLTPRRQAIVWTNPAAYVLALFTNPWHGLVWSEVTVSSFASLTVVVPEYGPIGWIELVIAYAVAVLAYVLLGRFYLRSHAGYRKQTGVILLAYSLAFVANGAYFLGFRLHPGFDPTPAFLAWTVFVFGWALYRYDFLEVTPLATDLLIEEMGDPVIVIGEGGHVLECNDAAADLFPVEVDDRPSLRTVLPDLDAALRSETERTIALSKDGETRVYDVRETPISDQHDERRGSLVVLRDVTLRKRRERELERQNEQLERFASIVSHDLRNPLSVATGHVENVRRGGEGDLDTAISALEAMDELIEDVLTLARDGRLVDDPGAVDLREAARTAWAHAETGDTELVVDADRVIEADERRLRRLLGNLFRNAIEHGDADRVRIGPLDDGFFVEDDGEGVAPEDRDSIFESGYSTAPDGTGLGLSIVEAIASAHGWTVSLAEGSNGGARFEFSGVRDDPAAGEGDPSRT